MLSKTNSCAADQSGREYEYEHEHEHEYEYALILQHRVELLASELGTSVERLELKAFLIL